MPYRVIPLNRTLWQLDGHLVVRISSTSNMWQVELGYIVLEAKKVPDRNKRLDLNSEFSFS